MCAIVYADRPPPIPQNGFGPTRTSIKRKDIGRSHGRNTQNNLKKKKGPEVMCIWYQITLHMCTPVKAQSKYNLARIPKYVNPE